MVLVEGRVVIIVFCFLLLCFLLDLSLCVCSLCGTRGWSFDGHMAGFIRRGVVVGGGFWSLRALRTLRPAGCLEFG
jgi:hypothetical protein